MRKTVNYQFGEYILKDTCEAVLYNLYNLGQEQPQAFLVVVTHLMNNFHLVYSIK